MEGHGYIQWVVRMTIRASKIFIDGSDLPLFSVQVTREVTASKGSYNEFANFSSESGKYYIFITVLKNGSVKPSHFVVNFDHSLSLANGSYNYYKLCQVEGATELDVDLEILLDATGGKLRLHRTSTGVGNTYDITIQNLADDSLAMTKPNIKGTDSWYPEAEGYIIYSASVPEKVDHRALSNIGKYTHQQIDSYIDNPKAPLTHTHNYQDVNDFINIVNGLIDAHGGGGSPAGNITWTSVQNKPFKTTITEQAAQTYGSYYIPDTKRVTILNNDSETDAEDPSQTTLKWYLSLGTYESPLDRIYAYNANITGVSLYTLTSNGALQVSGELMNSGAPSDVIESTLKGSAAGIQITGNLCPTPLGGVNIHWGLGSSSYPWGDAYCDNIYQSNNKVLDTSSTIVSSKVSAMTGYSKPDSASAISAQDSLNQAIGKLEYKIDNAGGSTSVEALSNEDISSIINEIYES